MTAATLVKQTAYQALRRRAREVALQVLFQEDLNPGATAAAGDALLRRKLSFSGLLEVDDEEGRYVREALLALAREERRGDPAEPSAELPPEALTGWTRERLAAFVRAEEVIAFGRAIVASVRARRATIDRLIEEAAENWSLNRMATTDRNVLRLGAYELLHTDTPPRVSINEAVELAKRYGSAQSAQFVNGILDRLMHGAEENRPCAADPDGGEAPRNRPPHHQNPDP